MKAEDWGRKKGRERDHKPCSGCNVISLKSPTSGHEYKNDRKYKLSIFPPKGCTNIGPNSELLQGLL